MGAAEIDALGAYDIGEVVRRTTETLALSAAPIIIVNGRRLPNPDLFFGFPPDALVRVEVLPREAGSLYGGGPDRRVLNLVLQRQFRSNDGMLNASRPTAGGTSTVLGDGRRSAISDNDTHQVGLRASRSTSLRTGERDQYSQNRGDSATLRPASDDLAANLTLTRAFAEWSGTFGAVGRVQENRATALLGNEAVEMRSLTHNLALTGGLSGEIRGWAMQFGLNGEFSSADQTGLATSHSTNGVIAATAEANRSVMELPAGPVFATLSGQASWSRSEVEALDIGTSRQFHLGDMRGNASIPLARSRSGPEGGAGGTFGDASLTVGASLTETGAGGGDGLNAILAWTPLLKIKLNGPWSTSTEALTNPQRFEPVVYGSPMIVYEFRTGDAAEVLPLRGGNPDLRPSHANQHSIAASAGPFTSWDFFGGVSLERTNTRDGISALPLATPELEAAFPERFHRDASGRLVSIDQRPLNLRSVVTETVSSNLTFTIPAGGARTGLQGRGGALRVALNQTRRLRNATLIRPGLPDMDRLAGDGGGMPRQEFSFLLDGRRGAWGMNATARWRGAYRVRRENGRSGPDDLRVASFSTVDLSLSFLAEGAVPPSVSGASSRRGVGFQLEMEVENLFDTRPAARLGDGWPAPGYRRDDQDSVGRSIRVTLKRRF